jgi:hypothetical protein
MPFKYLGVLLNLFLRLSLNKCCTRTNGHRILLFYVLSDNIHIEFRSLDRLSYVHPASSLLFSLSIINSLSIQKGMCEFKT